MTYRFPIVVGDRVALAPHLDLWMAGARFGAVEALGQWKGERFAHVRLDGHSDCVAIRLEDLLGAVSALPRVVAEQ